MVPELVTADDNDQLCASFSEEVVLKVIKEMGVEKMPLPCSIRNICRQSEILSKPSPHQFMQCFS